VLNGESLEMPGEIYLKSDPPRMYQVMRQTRKTCLEKRLSAVGRPSPRGTAWLVSAWSGQGDPAQCLKWRAGGGDRIRPPPSSAD
jgi:hypothetical protein